jgi:hypothetical protein
MKQYLNKRVIIKSKRGTLYSGILSGFRENESLFCLTRLVVLNKQGMFVAAPKTKHARWFTTSKYEIRLENKEDMK